VDFNFSSEVINITGNRSEFEQLFFILIQNASQQANIAGRDCRMLISITADDDNVYIKAFDDCGGIDEKNVAHIFEPFFTTKGDGKGTGLGLCILERIVNNHGGEVEVENRPGEGVCFIINLPKQ
jgi:signal transduction histidine kinase